jgi:hypothetical protein
MVVQAAEGIPTGGGFNDKSALAASNLIHSVSASQDGLSLNINPQAAHPSFCSGATYLVFLSVVNALIQNGKIQLSREAVRAIRPQGQDDNVGVWGYWNNSNRGAADLFDKLGLGPTFNSFEDARPGDFMNIDWKSGGGHSVIFLGLEGDQVKFWSSNVSTGGFGEKTASRQSIQRATFSRLEHPEKLAGAGSF